jgi:predicted CXXCH cytochrome family protein
VPCASCHIGGNYTTVPTDCYSCHKADYTGTTNPNHIAAGFPTTCTTCHTTWTTSGWAGATFNHTWFPIPHHSARLCSDCHTNPSDYTVFVCTSCHTQGPTTSEHSGVKGFVWNSANCYACHKNGGG